MPVSESKKRSNSKHDKDNWQYQTFKTRTGAKERIAEAAAATGMSVNGFIRDALDKAVMTAINKPLEPSHVDAAKATCLRMFIECVIKDIFLNTNDNDPYQLSQEEKEVIELLENTIEENPSLYMDLLNALASDLPPKTKGKKIRDAENDTRIQLREFMAKAHMYNRIKAFVKKP